MKKSAVLSAVALALTITVCTQAARADTRDATCEVRKDGDKQKGKSGPCTFGQRQGYIDIDLKNGDTIRLSPAGNPNHYRDQHGNKVTRKEAGTTAMSLKWENGKHIEVTWHGNPYGSYDSHGKHSGHSSSREYGINPLDNGQFEVVSSNPFCTVRFNRHGEPQHHSDDCTSEQKRESYEYAQRHR